MYKEYHSTVIAGTGVKEIYNFAKVGYDKWYGPMGRNLTFEMYLESILSSKAGKAIQKVQGDHATVEEMQELRRSGDMMQKCQLKKVRSTRHVSTGI